MSLAFLHSCNPVWPKREGNYVSVTEARCTGCQSVKPLGAFNINKKHKNGRQYRCKACESIRNAEARRRG
jgi:Fe-S-cluster-containing hydrogenase component 2